MNYSLKLGDMKVRIEQTEDGFIYTIHNFDNETNPRHYIIGESETMMPPIRFRTYTKALLSVVRQINRLNSHSAQIIN